ncbi:MAG TPA: hypothetical protein VGM63_17135 [Mucilaginibacter sp.]|jgi:NADPH-dependent ferric siderophore reductase
MGFKDKAVALLEGSITKHAAILEVRAWDKGTFFEIGLHLPDADFSRYDGAMHLSCRVPPLTFRDYTVTAWDAETKTCSLLIDAAHDGLGSAWVKTLENGGNVTYIHIESHRQPPLQTGRILFLGDQSAIGHFLALQQLAGGNPAISGAVIIPDSVHRKQLKYFYPDLTLIPIPLQRSYSQTLTDWLRQQPLNDFEFICIAGHIPMVVDTRRYLKNTGVSSAKIKAEGFWK